MVGPKPYTLIGQPVYIPYILGAYFPVTLPSYRTVFVHVPICPISAQDTLETVLKRKPPTLDRATEQQESL